MNVYFLKDPNDNEIKYVGITKKAITQRLAVHIKDAKTKQRKGKYLSNKEKWILFLLSQNKKPIVECVYSNISENQAVDLEKSLISKYKREYEGGILKNIQEGGFYNGNKEFSVWNKGLRGSCKNITEMSINQPHRKTIYRFDKKCNLIDQWYSLRKMCKELNFDRRVVMRCLKNEPNYLSYKGYMFSYTIKAPQYENKSKVLSGANSPHAKKVIGFMENKEYKFDTIQDAASYFNVSASCISSALSGRQKTSCKLFWKYYNECTEN